MLLTITTTHRPATDLGYLLHKNPARTQRLELSFGRAYVAYPEASTDRRYGPPAALPYRRLSIKLIFVYLPRS